MDVYGMIVVYRVSEALVVTIATSWTHAQEAVDTLLAKGKKDIPKLKPPKAKGSVAALLMQPTPKAMAVKSPAAQAPKLMKTSKASAPKPPKFEATRPKSLSKPEARGPDSKPLSKPFFFGNVGAVILIWWIRSREKIGWLRNTGKYF